MRKVNAVILATLIVTSVNFLVLTWQVMGGAEFCGSANTTDLDHDFGAPDSCTTHFNIKTISHATPFLSHSRIRINGNGDFVIGSNGVVRGTGSSGNPYVIENWFINANSGGSAIYIGNSSIYFVIQNCILENTTWVSTPYLAGGGIILNKVSNGTVIHNHCNYDREGVFIYSTSKNNAVRFNELASSTDDGVHIDASTSGNTISYNNITSSGDVGIYMFTTTSNIVSYNKVTSSTNGGILLSTSCIDNTILHNTIVSSGQTGINLGTSNTNNIRYNVITGSGNYGINLDGSNGNNVSYNNVTSGTWSGIHLLNSDQNKIKVNNDTGNSWGIYVDTSDNNELDGNSIFLNSRTGIYLLNSNGNKVRGDNISNNTERGIMLEGSSNTEITSNNVLLNSRTGIYLLNSNGNKIKGNEISNNTERGIMLEGSSNAEITSNNVSSSGQSGIYIYRTSILNSITGNRAILNTQDGISLDDSCSGNAVTKNRVLSNQRYGIQIFFNSNYNTVTFNNISDSSNYGIYGSMTPSYNIFHHNNLIDNNGGGVQGSDGSGFNSWNNTAQRGNWWSDYQLRYPTATSNGFYWSIPYDMDGGLGAKDLYPLAEPVSGKINQPPVATIDLISPNPAIQGQTVSFSGHGNDSDGTIVAYNWRSSLDGGLSNIASFSTSILSVGTHSIYFQVKDNNDTWSLEVSANLIVNPLGFSPLEVVASAVPSTIKAGGGTSTVTAYVTNKTSGLAIAGATLTGELAPQIGTLATFVDAGSGYYTTIYTPPATIGITTQITIYVNTTKTGFLEGHNTTIVTVEPPAGIKTYTIDGNVYKVGTAIPIPSATILVNPGSRSTTTDSAGYYKITGLTNGTYTIAASKTGYVTNTTGFVINGADITRNIDIANSSTTTYALSGHVYNAGTAQPISGGMVSLIPGSKTTTSDGTGYYQITGLTNGTYTRTVSKTGFYDSITPVIVSGADVIQDIYLVEKLGGTYSVSGKVYKLSTSLSISSAIVTANPSSKTSTSDLTGNYLITGLSSGIYTLTTTKSGFIDNSTQVTISSTDIVLDIYLSEVLPDTIYNLTGHVYIKGTTQVIPDATVDVDSGAKLTTTDVSGKYQIAGLTNGSHALKVSKTGYTANSTTISIAGTDVVQDLYLVPRGADSGYSVSGHIYDIGTNRIIPNATVAISSLAISTITNSSGYYQFSNLPNGTFTMTISIPGYINGTVNFTISGASVIKDVYLTPVSNGGGSNGDRIDVFGLKLDYLCFIIGLVILIVIFVLLLLFMMRMRKTKKDTVVVIATPTPIPDDTTSRPPPLSATTKGVSSTLSGDGTTLHPPPSSTPKKNIDPKTVESQKVKEPKTEEVKKDDIKSDKTTEPPLPPEPVRGEPDETTSLPPTQPSSIKGDPKQSSDNTQVQSETPTPSAKETANLDDQPPPPPPDDDDDASIDNEVNKNTSSEPLKKGKKNSKK